MIYYRTIWDILKGALTFVGIGKWGHKEAGVLGFKLLLATGFTVGVALLIEPYFTSILTLYVVGITLIITGLLIWGAERFRPKKERALSWKLAAMLGLVQGVAVIPGISRSGLTIAFLIYMGINRQESVRTSFLLSIPTIAGAGVFAWQKGGGEMLMTPVQWWGGVASFLTALFVIYGMKRLIESHWIWFAPYCVLLGGGILLWVFYGN